MADRLTEIRERDAFSLNETQTEQDRRWLLNELVETREKLGARDALIRIYERTINAD